MFNNCYLEDAWTYHMFGQDNNKKEEVGPQNEVATKRAFDKVMIT